jgi:hypothetical protein
MNKEKTSQKEQYIAVPCSWFERLVEISKMSRNDDKLGKQFLLGYISSAETILKYAKRVDEF